MKFYQPAFNDEFPLSSNIIKLCTLEVITTSI